MRLVTFSFRSEARIGALISKGAQNYILDLNRAVPSLPADMIEFLNMGAAAMAAAKDAVAAADDRFLILQSAATLRAPVPQPGKIICVGYNYRDHTTASGADPATPEYPNFFAKYANVVIGPDEPLVYPRVSIQMDYEAELALIVGKRARYVDEAHALDVVAGYTIFNDVTARDYQNRTRQWTIGKSFDTFGPMGPALVTPDEIPDPRNLDLRLTLNGQEMQHSNTRHMIFSIPCLIAYLTQAITLEPGDVISTGTPSGIGSMRQPPVFMKPGDTVRIRIEHIGELENPVVEERL